MGVPHGKDVDGRRGGPPLVRPLVRGVPSWEHRRRPWPAGTTLILLVMASGGFRGPAQSSALGLRLSDADARSTPGVNNAKGSEHGGFHPILSFIDPLPAHRG
ncbi:hypothetical protein SBA4_5210004 [Candidatus Sulfopaludibacter sp. SbA4]|nr:hypothetical protein SBA4_5210004 [Candidatus Sulfopaludibacter sp. SbA4]